SASLVPSAACGSSPRIVAASARRDNRIVPQSRRTRIDMDCVGRAQRRRRFGFTLLGTNAPSSILNLSGQSVGEIEVLIDWTNKYLAAACGNPDYRVAGWIEGL